MKSFFNSRSKKWQTEKYHLVILFDDKVIHMFFKTCPFLKSEYTIELDKHPWTCCTKGIYRGNRLELLLFRKQGEYITEEGRRYRLARLVILLLRHDRKYGKWYRISCHDRRANDRSINCRDRVCMKLGW